MSTADQCMRPPGEYALASALELWTENIIDPQGDDESPIAVRSRAAITAMIHVGLGWTWEPAYLGEGPGLRPFEWCGAMAATAWSAAGLKAAIRKKSWASTYRLRVWSQGNDRRISYGQVRQGDILIVGHSDPVNGDHITMVTGPNTGGLWPTVSGNGRGKGPDGSYRQGVVRRDYGPESVRYAVRPLDEDLDVA